ncbi:MAG: glycosyltransferase [Xanthobacteraceae bacterium]|nr:glycosyltransferase [Xanthobacteraceae bacterium]
MMTGLRYARGEQVFLIDSDLEEEPEWLMTFLEQKQRENCDVVYGVQDARRGDSIERWSGQLYYWVVRATTGLMLPDNIVTARLMSREYVDALLLHDEREMFMAGLWSITGFDQRPQTVHKHANNTTTYTFGRKVTLLVNSITSFSSAPLVGIFYLGLFISLVAGTYTAYLIIHWVFLANPPSGWTSVMASIWLLGGLVILFIGIIGIYLSKIFSEAKRRPYTIVRKVHGRRNE